VLLRAVLGPLCLLDNPSRRFDERPLRLSGRFTLVAGLRQALGFVSGGAIQWTDASWNSGYPHIDIRSEPSLVEDRSDLVAKLAAGLNRKQ
jgi:hypothetical protein